MAVVDRDRKGPFQGGSGRREGADVFAFRAELLDPVVALICDVDIARRFVDGHPGRVRELARTRAPAPEWEIEDVPPLAQREGGCAREQQCNGESADYGEAHPSRPGGAANVTSSAAHRSLSSFFKPFRPV